MTQTVTDESGQVHNFPDEATPEMIGEALGLGGSGGAKGIAAPSESTGPYIAAKGANSLMEFLAGNPMGRAKTPDGKSFGWEPDLASAHDWLTRQITGTSNPQPAGPVARYGGAVASAVGGNPLMAIAMPATTVAGAIGGEGAHEAFPNSDIAPVAGGLAGGLGIGGLKSLFSGNAIGKLAGKLGSSQTWEDAGEALQDNARHWINNVFPGKQSAAWAPVDAAIPAGTPMQLQSFDQALHDITSNAGQLQSLVKTLRPQLPEKLLNQFVNQGGKATSYAWSDVQKLRSAVGDAMTNPELVNKLGPANVKKLYAALTDDMNGTAVQQGAGDLFADANKESSRLYNLAEGPMSRVIGGATKTAADKQPGDVAKRLISGGKNSGEDLANLRGEMPDAVDELAAAHLLQTPKGWTKLSPEAREALVPDEGMRNSINYAVKNAGAATDASKTAHGMASTVGALVGPEVAEILSHLYGSTVNPLIPGAYGGVLGAAAPVLYRGAASIARNPGQLKYPLIGVDTGMSWQR